MYPSSPILSPRYYPWFRGWWGCKKIGPHGPSNHWLKTRTSVNISCCSIRAGMYLLGSSIYSYQRALTAVWLNSSSGWIYPNTPTRSLRGLLRNSSKKRPCKRSGDGMFPLRFNQLLPLLGAWIHDQEPCGYHQTQNHHTRITRGHLRCRINGLKGLVFLVGFIMVVWMSAQFKQNQSTHHVIAIPRVFWLNNFILAGLGFLPPESVMFDIVDGFKEYANDEIVTFWQDLILFRHKFSVIWNNLSLL